MKQGEGRPAKGYRNAAGKRVPGVTTITGRFKEAGGLIHWAWNLGMDGTDYRKVRDDAAGVGHMAHSAIDAYIHNRPVPDFPGTTHEDRSRAKRAFETFLEWATQVGLEVKETETPLVSEEHQYGGTFDALAVVAGRLVLLDWKSSGGIYAETLCQVAAYRNLLRERGDSVDEAQILRVGKEMGDFHHHGYTSEILDLAWDAFLHQRALYEIDKRLKKVAA